MGAKSTNSRGPGTHETDGHLLEYFRNNFSDGSVTKFADAVPISATGGTTATPGNGYKYHFFTSSGSLVVSDGPGNIDYIVIGGGGAGGSFRGGGGGAGGVNSNWPGFPGSNADVAYTVSPGTYPVTVGTGGNPTSTVGNQGNDSVFNDPNVNSGVTITGTGGGGGGGRSSNDGNHIPGTPGGSGGGGSDNTSSSGTAAGGAADDNPGEVGNEGGTATKAYGGAGGGGAGSDGGDATPSDEDRTGGNGIGFAEIPSDYGTPGPNGSLRYFAGGGGGHQYSNTPKAGGYGGGGASAGPSSNPGTQGTNFTGSGGGGAGERSPGGGQGGTGIVIIRYPV